MRRARFVFGLAALAASLACRARWTAAEAREFRTICAGGRSDATCLCMLRELPPLMSFDEYLGLAKGRPAGHDESLRKLVHAATLCSAQGP
jgi:hypothetical protein